MSSEAGNQPVLEQEEDLPTYVVIVIGVICAIIVIILLVILIYLCLKRRQSSKDEEENNKPMATVKPQQGNPGNGHAPTALRPLQQSYDNPSLDKSHSPVDERLNNSVFATSENGHPPYDPYNGKMVNGGIHNNQPYYHDNNTNIQRERSFKSSRDVVDHRNQYPNDKQVMYLEDPYGNKQQQGHLAHKDAHNNSGEGSTSSDPKQPKKVMYEAVV